MTSLPKPLPWIAAVNGIAETHYMLRPALLQALEMRVITPQGQAVVGPHSTYAELWQHQYGDRFFDMGTFIRLGTTIETGLRDYYRTRLGLKSLTELTVSLGFFQRLGPDKGLIPVFRSELGLDLEQISELHTVREIMIHRHLYAHRSGLVDSKYIQDLLDLTGNDLAPTLAAEGYPDEDVYWFEPLRRLPAFIEGARLFFMTLPSPEDV